uniref:THAP domain-containing protein 1 n=1 Tax=Hucho hucho TaxID=62062 RepID=A0A4W5LL02_9TELE
MPKLSLCSAYNCKNRSPKAGVGFFRSTDHCSGFLASYQRFPKNDPERHKQWIINMKCKGWNPQQNHRVCSVHFEDKYICGRDMRQRLKPDAVPTIFDYPKNFQKSITWPVKDVAPKVACENMEFQLPPLKHIIEIKEAWEWLVIDIRGPLPLTLNGHQYVLTLTDFYSKWVEAFPLRGCSSTEVAQHVAEVISHFGFPFGILVRLKKNFTSKINVALKSRLKLRGFSLLYRHWQVGSLDLATQTQISRMVSDLVNDHPYNWDVCIPAKVFSLCFKEHPKTKQRPFSLLCCKGPQPVTTPRDLSFSPAELRESSFAIQSNQEGGQDTDPQGMVGIESGKETAGKSTVTRVSFFRSNTESNTDGNTISNTDGNLNSEPSSEDHHAMET